MKVKIDEDLPEQVADVFSSHGHDATTVRIQGWSGMPDDELWSRSQAEGRTLVTADKGLADLRQYRPSYDTATILLRLREESRRAYIELARSVVQSVHLNEVLGCLVVATRDNVRVRRVAESERGD